MTAPRGRGPRVHQRMITTDPVRSIRVAAYGRTSASESSVCTRPFSPSTRQLVGIQVAYLSLSFCQWSTMLLRLGGRDTKNQETGQQSQPTGRQSKKCQAGTGEAASALRKEPAGAGPPGEGRTSQADEQNAAGLQEGSRSPLTVKARVSNFQRNRRPGSLLSRTAPRPARQQARASVSEMQCESARREGPATVLRTCRSSDTPPIPPQKPRKRQDQRVPRAPSHGPSNCSKRGSDADKAALRGQSQTLEADFFFLS
uniref:Uncharacterized protein LOC112812641 n=1 Tax=Callorhinus ursinus TaxID=34884 RepID=A0A3Q7N113_CALUR|nr:uncharacterized protein LOC112812641 [Callorhinus ursinus]